MNKSLATNLLAALAVLAGLLAPEPYGALVLSVGLFALSGALTNWIAVHMLFERIPGFYGSGIIPLRFNEFKRGIHDLLMSTFFTPENVERLLSRPEATPAVIRLDPVLDSADLSGAFTSLVGAIKESRFGGMLAMIGGEAGLEPMRAPFEDKLRAALLEMTQTPAVQTALRDALTRAASRPELLEEVDHLVTQRLDELTPKMVKDIVSEMIRRHLGWLVVWGGVFGGLIGLVAELLRRGL